MVTREQIQALADAIGAKFPEVEKIILFGSYAYGQPRESSDVDLLVIMASDRPPHSKAVEVWGAVRPPYTVDLIVRTPDDTERRYRQADPLIREALDGGVLLYERRVARVA